MIYGFLDFWVFVYLSLSLALSFILFGMTEKEGGWGRSPRGAGGNRIGTGEKCPRTRGPIALIMPFPFPLSLFPPLPLSHSRYLSYSLGLSLSFNLLYTKETENKKQLLKPLFLQRVRSISRSLSLSLSLYLTLSRYLSVSLSLSPDS